MISVNSSVEVVNGENATKMVFLVGPPRSGTTWLQGLLANHPDIGTAQESHLFNHLFRPMMDAWNHLLNFDDGRGGIGLPAYLTEEQFIETLRQTADRVYSSVPEYSENRLFLDKTPDHIRCIEMIRRVYPDAKIVVLLRRPEDVIESLLSAGKSWGRHWAPSSVFSAVRQYRYFFSVKGTDDLLLNDNELCVVRYEQLKKSPSDTLKIVLEYLDASVSDSVLSEMVSKKHTLRKYGEFSTRSGVEVSEPENFARKKKGSLTWFQKSVISTLLGKHIRLYGYANDDVKENIETELLRAET